ncbi:MAG: hypothetical protein DRJ38_03830 [Thermoprotei archaeon]|nr:MAG: hypothetical protein DRJ38_03830 [Thermoprotei archaeon]
MKPKHIFRAYDIRGIFGKDLTPDIAAAIGMALGTHDPGRFIVGGDTRASTLVIKQALTAGLTATGCDVIEIGIVPIGAAIYACWTRKVSTAYVTASHLPPEWNGVKLYGRKALSYTSEEVKKVEEIFSTRSFKEMSWSNVGKIEKEDVLEEYKDYLMKFATVSGLKIVVDCGNGATALIVPQLLKELGHTVVEINCEVDPRFPGRGPEPEPEKLGELSKAVIESNADFGIAFDGDGDRVVFVDRDGKILSAEQVAVIMLTGGVKGDVVANVECSSILDEYVESYGGRVYRVPVGHTFMVRKVVETGAVLGVEKSNHFSVPLNPLIEEGILTCIYFIECLAKLKGKISEYIPSVRPIKRLKIPVEEDIKFEVAKRVKEEILGRFEDVDIIDGARVNFDYGWFLVRPSNTEPLIRITSEGVDEKEAQRLLKIAEDIVLKVLKDFKHKR